MCLPCRTPVLELPIGLQTKIDWTCWWTSSWLRLHTIEPTTVVFQSCSAQQYMLLKKQVLRPEHTTTVAYYHMGDKTLLGSLNHVKILSNFVDPCKTTVLHTIRKVSLHFDGISTREYVVIIPSDASQFFHSLTHTYTPASIPSPSPPRSSHGPSPSIPKVSSGLSIMRLCD
jgi:hypothetical protein